MDEPAIISSQQNVLERINTFKSAFRDSEDG